MKRNIKAVLAVVLVAVMALALAACGETKVAAQGIDATNHVINVGNTAATTGLFASVGIPFNYGMEAAFWYFTEHGTGYADPAGNKYTIKLTHYDDEFNGTKGVTFTEQLVEDDMVFALVGHFGSNTVAATVDYIEQQGIPMVYGVCGVPQLYKTERNVMTIQPIYNTEGLSMLATAVAKADNNVGLGGKKIGVIATTDEAGASIKAGIVEEASKLGLVTGTDIFLYDVDAAATEFAAAVEGLKAQNCDVVIIASNQAPFINIANQFVTSGYDNVKLLTSYVSANYGTMSGLLASGVITATREIYAGAWLVTGSAPADTKGWKDFVECTKQLTIYDKNNGTALLKADDATYGAYVSGWFGTEDWAADGISANFLNAYAMAGFVAGRAFCQGLERMSGKVLTWEDFIAAMEQAPIDVPMGGSVNYANGERIGIAALAVNRYTVANFAVGEVYRAITDLSVIEAAKG